MELSFVLPFSLILFTFLVALLVFILILAIIKKIKFLTPKWKRLAKATAIFILFGMFIIVLLVISDINNPKKVGEGNFIGAMHDLLLKIIFVAAIVSTIGDGLFLFYFLSRMKYFDFWSKLFFIAIETILVSGVFILWSKIF